MFPLKLVCGFLIGIHLCSLVSYQPPDFYGNLVTPNPFSGLARIVYFHECPARPCMTPKKLSKVCTFTFTILQRSKQMCKKHIRNSTYVINSVPVNKHLLSLCHLQEHARVVLKKSLAICQVHAFFVKTARRMDMWSNSDALK